MQIPKPIVILSAIFCFSTVFLAACSKDNTPVPTVPTGIITFTYKQADTAAPGQLVTLKAELPSAGGTAPATYKWICSSGEIKGNGPEVTWIPDQTGLQQITLQTTSANKQTELHRDFVVIKPFFRWARLSDPIEYIRKIEQHYGSLDNNSGEGQISIKITTASQSNTWESRLSKEGDYIVYTYVNGILNSGAVNFYGRYLWPLSNEGTLENYYHRYFEFKDLLKEYGTVVDEELFWDDSPYTTLYQSKPEWLGAAIAIGILRMRTTFEIENHKCYLSIGSTYGANEFYIARPANFYILISSER